MTKETRATLAVFALFLALAGWYIFAQPGALRMSGSALPAAESPRLAAFDLNGADEEELQQLPGVGPVLASRIVRARAEQGAFRSVEDLLYVDGIGPATLEKIYLYLEEY